jgi:hypothetical protein
MKPINTTLFFPMKIFLEFMININSFTKRSRKLGQFEQCNNQDWTGIFNHKPCLQ